MYCSGLQEIPCLSLIGSFSKNFLLIWILNVAGKWHRSDAVHLNNQNVGVCIGFSRGFAENVSRLYLQNKQVKS